MDQRKYLVYIALSLHIHFISFQVSANTPWLPEKGKYNVATSTAIIDDESEDLKQIRVDLFIKVEDRVDELIKEIMILEDAHSWEKVRQKKISASREVTEFLRKIVFINNPAVVKELVELKITSKKQIVEEFKASLCDLSAYQQKIISHASIEYAPKDNMSFGIKGDYLENAFTPSRYISTSKSSNMKTAEIFYKYKMFQNKNFIFTLQPKFIFNKHSNFHSDEIFHEMAFLSGITKKIGELEVFTQMSIAIGGGTSKSTKSKKYSYYEYMEGVKFPFGITVAKFAKKSFRSNCGLIYEKNIYEQFSVAKKFEFGNLKRKNFTIQLGYFKEYNPKYPMFEVSGSVFSLWSEI